MPTADTDNLTNPAEALTRTQKLAVLLLMLGPDSAAQILKSFPESEVETLAVEMGRFGFVSHDLQQAVLHEFAEVAIQASTSVSGGTEFVRNVLEKAVGQHRATTIATRAAGDAARLAILKPLIEADPRELFNLVKTEQPQVIALITSHLMGAGGSGLGAGGQTPDPRPQTPDPGAALLNQCPPELRDKVVERLATLSPTPIEVIERIVAVLRPKLGIKPTRGTSATGGVKSAATLLNNLDKTVSKTVLTSIEERNPDLSKAIRQKMFTFEDLVRLDGTALQKVMREVDTRDLAVALKRASEPVTGALLGAISKRAAETVKEEMGFLGSLKAKEIEAAQLRVVDIVRRLEGEGEIELNPQEEKADAVAA